MALSNSAGNEVTFTVDVNRYIPLDPGIWRGINHFKIRSGTLAVPVNQGADRVLTIVSRLAPAA